MNCKYHLNDPNIFCCRDRNASPFLKGFLWAAQAAKMGYRWKYGNGRRIRFWEDQWIGTCSFAIQFLEIYLIVNEKGISLRDAWDGANLRFTFTRTVDRRLMNMWLELKQIVSLIELVEEEDSIIWQYTCSGVFSVQSLYAIVNNRGVKPVYSVHPCNVEHFGSIKGAHFSLVVGK
jgi:hypothetical protein